MNKMDVFEIVVAATFERLYSEFPDPIYLEPVSLVPNDLASFTDEQNSEYKTHWDAQKLAFNTVMFLLNEGFIRCERVNSNVYAFTNVSLTMKGLTTLQQVPKELGGKTFGDQFKEVLKDGGTEAIKSLVKQVLAAAMNLS